MKIEDDTYAAVELLVSEAKQLRDHARDLQEQAKEARSLSRDTDARAVEMIAPFKRLDVIEYKTKGYSGQMRAFRVTVDVTSFDGECVKVTGRQVSKKGKLSNGRKEAFLFGDKDEFVRIVGKIVSIGEQHWEVDFEPVEEE